MATMKVYFEDKDKFLRCIEVRVIDDNRGAYGTRKVLEGFVSYDTAKLILEVRPNNKIPPLLFLIYKKIHIHITDQSNLDKSLQLYKRKIRIWV